MRRILTLSTVALVLGVVRPLIAQSFQGVVSLTDGKSPAVNARVWLLGDGGHVVDTARTNQSGGFTLRAPRLGEYWLLVRRIGYLPEHTDPILLAEGQVRRDTIVTLSAREMQPVVVEVTRDARRYFGVDVRQVGSRFIGPEQMDRLRVGVFDIVDVLRRASLAGVSVERMGLDSICVRSRVAHAGCAPIFLDGIRLGTDLPFISADEVQAILVLRPLDGAMVGGNGAVMLYTGR